MSLCDDKRYRPAPFVLCSTVSDPSTSFACQENTQKRKLLFPIERFHMRRDAIGAAAEFCSIKHQFQTIYDEMNSNTRTRKKYERRNDKLKESFYVINVECEEVEFRQEDAIVVVLERASTSPRTYCLPSDITLRQPHDQFLPISFINLPQGWFLSSLFVWSSAFDCEIGERGESKSFPP